MNVKICGLTRTGDAELALQLGAWAIGFIFYPQSPRYVEPETVSRILRRLNPPTALCVGVFVNPTLDFVKESVEKAGLTAIQLHGNETLEFCQEIKNVFPGTTLIKARRANEAPISRFADYELLDHQSSDAWGGTGVAVDWEKAAEFRQKRSLILAGGLNADNVARAIQIVHPAAIDLSSGVEESPGIKSAVKMRAFFEAVQRSTS